MHWVRQAFPNKRKGSEPLPPVMPLVFLPTSGFAQNQRSSLFLPWILLGTNKSGSLSSCWGAWEKFPQVFGKPTVFLGGSRNRPDALRQILRSKIESVWQPKSTQRFFQRSFQQLQTNLACGPVSMDVIETVAPAACESVCKKKSKLFSAKTHKNTCSTPTIYMTPKLGGTMQNENPTSENRSHKDSLFVDYFSKDRE